MKRTVILILAFAGLVSGDGLTQCTNATAFHGPIKDSYDVYHPPIYGVQDGAICHQSDSHCLLPGDTAVAWHIRETPNNNWLQRTRLGDREITLALEPQLISLLGEYRSLDEAGYYKYINWLYKQFANSVWFSVVTEEECQAAKGRFLRVSESTVKCITDNVRYHDQKTTLLGETGDSTNPGQATYCFEGNSTRPRKLLLWNLFETPTKVVRSDDGCKSIIDLKWDSNSVVKEHKQIQNQQACLMMDGCSVISTARGKDSGTRSEMAVAYSGTSNQAYYTYTKYEYYIGTCGSQGSVRAGFGNPVGIINTTNAETELVYNIIGTELYVSGLKHCEKRVNESFEIAVDWESVNSPLVSGDETFCETTTCVENPKRLVLSYYYVPHFCYNNESYPAEFFDAVYKKVRPIVLLNHTRSPRSLDSTEVICDGVNIHYGVPTSTLASICKGELCVTKFLEKAGTWELPMDIGTAEGVLTITAYGKKKTVVCPQQSTCDYIQCDWCSVRWANLSCWKWFHWMIMVTSFVMCLMFIGFVYKYTTLGMRALKFALSPLIYVACLIYITMKHTFWLVLRIGKWFKKNPSSIVLFARVVGAFEISAIELKCNGPNCVSVSKTLIKHPVVAHNYTALILSDKKEKVGMVKLNVMETILGCEKEELYWTGNFTMKFESKCTCLKATGSCTGHSSCGLTHTTSKFGDNKPLPMSDYKCTYQGWGGCGWCFLARACYFNKMTWRDPVYPTQVYRCSSWSPRVMVALEVTIGSSTNKYASTLQPGESLLTPQGSLAFEGTTSFKNRLLSRNYLRVEDGLGERKTYTVKSVSQRDLPQAPLIGNFQCKSRELRDCIYDKINSYSWNPDEGTNKYSTYFESIADVITKGDKLPIGDDGMVVRETGDRVEAVVSDHVIGTFGLTLHNLAVFGEEPKYLANIGNIKIEGLINNLHGALITGSCSSTGVTVAYVECKGIEPFSIVCDGAFKHRVRADKESIAADCVVTTAKGATKTRIMGNLKRIPMHLLGYHHSDGHEHPEKISEPGFFDRILDFFKALFSGGWLKSVLGTIMLVVLGVVAVIGGFWLMMALISCLSRVSWRRTKAKDEGAMYIKDFEEREEGVVVPKQDTVTFRARTLKPKKKFTLKKLAV